MKLKRISFLSLFFGVYLLVFASNLSSAEWTDNLIPARHFYAAIPGENPNVFWWPRVSDSMTFKNGMLLIETKGEKQFTCSFTVSVENELGSAVKLKFRGKVTGGTGSATIALQARERRTEIRTQSIKIKSPTWETYSLKVYFSEDVGFADLFFTAKGERCELSVKDVSIKMVKKPATVSQKIKIQSGADEAVPVSGIYIVKSSPRTEFYDEKAAKILRRYLYKATGAVLPLKRLDNAKAIAKPGAIMIGQAALKSGLVENKAVSELKSGGYYININNGVVILAGGGLDGVISGTYALLEKVLDVVFVSEFATEPKISQRDLLVFKEGTLSKNPAFTFRIIQGSPMPGFSDINIIGDARIIGATSAFTCHTAAGLVDFDKYHKTNPEFFALQKDGKRLRRDPSRRRFDVHFCLSNKAVHELIATQVILWMEADPQAKYFWVTQGDARRLWCQCRDCKAMDYKPGIYMDRMLKFINSIAKIVAEEFPENIILTLAYLEVEEAPIKTKPAPNVRVMYCPYPRNWSNHLKAFCEKHNVEGMRTLRDWLKWSPENLYIFAYPSSCPEPLSIWPAFYANYEKIMYYAKHDLKGIFFCGLRGVTRWFGVGSNSFNAMSRFVLGKVLWDPSLDVEKEIDRFMQLYYGPAAPYMRDFFNLIHQEVVDRQFAQHTEETKRGFVTKELAVKSHALFAKAEKAVAGNQRFLTRVLLEKVYLLWSDISDRTRASGRISEKELPLYADKLAEFTKLAKKFGIRMFVRGETPQDWFWKTSLLKLHEGIWFNDPLIARLINNPLDTLRDSVKLSQEKITGGYRILGSGFGGGQTLASYSYRSPRRDNVKVVRRMSSGYGRALTYLYLDRVPAKGMKFQFEGMDNEKPGVASMRLTVNKKVLFEGKVPFPKNDWNWHSFDVPASVLKRGRNLIVLENTTPDIVTEEEREAVDFIVGRKKCYFWGWYIISEFRAIEKK